MARLVTAEDSAAPRVERAPRVDPPTGTSEPSPLSEPETPVRTPHDLRERLLWPLAVAGGCLAVLVGLAAAVLDVEVAHAVPALADGPVDTWSSFVGYLLLVGLAMIVLRREGRHPVGWLLLLLALLTGAEGLSAQLGVLGLHVGGHDVAAASVWAVVSESLQRPEFGVALAILAVFPDGHVPSRRWRWLAWALAVLFSAWFLAHLLRPEPLEEEPFQGLANPLGLHWLGGAFLHYFFLPAAGVLALAVVASMVVRFRRSRGDERQQLKWLGFLAAGGPVSLAALGLSQLWGPAAMNVAGDVVWLFMSIGLPLAVVVAITRYRLYDLDLLVNRTVVYGAVSLSVLTTYAVVVLVAGRVVVHSGWTSPWVVATATVAAAVVAAPARRVAQSGVDRLFGRRAWDAVRQVERFAARWREQPQHPEAVRAMFADALRDPSVELGFWLRGPATYVLTDGRPATIPPPGGGRSAMYVDMHGEPVAVVLHSDWVDRDRALVRSVAQAAGLVTENARLQAELLLQLAEVEASRSRILEAADAERRRFERDLHDGAQQRLVALAMRIRLAVRGAGQDTPVLTEAADELGRAVRELRELSRGVHPAALDHGLDAALEALGTRTPVPVVLDVPVHLPATVELTTYYLACEAITNAIKHAAASRIDVRIEVGPGEVVLTVCDDGCGGADARRGSGLTGLGDRAAAAGGSVAVVSPPGDGTVVTARLPCDS